MAELDDEFGTETDEMGAAHARFVKELR